MNKKENRRKFGQFATFGGLVVFASVLMTMLVLIVALPTYKNQVVSAATRNSITYSEEELQKAVENYFASVDMNVGMEEYLSKSDIEPLREDLTLELEELFAERDASASYELDKTKAELNNTKSELLEQLEIDSVKMQEYMNSQQEYNTSVDEKIKNNAETISNVDGKVENVTSEVDGIQTQLSELQNYMGNCVIRYNPEDGHFYSVYMEGTEEEVSKKLDFAQ